MNTVIGRVDSKDPIVKEFEDLRKLRYQGTPTAIYRHILMAEVKDATAALPPVGLFFLNDLFISVIL